MNTGVHSSTGLSISVLRVLPEPRARNLLRRHLERAGASLHPDALREGLRQLLSAREDAQPIYLLSLCSFLTIDKS